MANRPIVEPPRRRAVRRAYTGGRPEAERKGVAAVETAVAVLRVLDFAGGPLSLSQIARAAGLRPSRTHHHLVSLVRTELASQDPATGLYTLGDYARRLGRAARNRGLLAGRVAEAMHALSRLTRQSSMFSQWSARGPVVTHWTDGRRALTVASRVGAPVPLWGSPTGEIFLAWLPERTVARVVRQGLVADAIERQVQLARARVRREGAAYAAGRRNAAIAAVAAPVFQPDGALAGALTVIGLRGDMDDSPGAAADVAVREAAVQVSRQLRERAGRQG